MSHFKPSEFACQCGCGGTVEPALIERLGRVRTALGAPIRVTSGYRCTEHNRKVGGVPNSQHVLGRAADVTCDPEHFGLLVLLVAQEFKAVGLAKGWLHVDLRDDKVRRWNY